MVIVPILQKEKPRHRGLMTCQDHQTIIWEWQTRDPNPSFQTQRPGLRTYEVADLGLGSKETRVREECQWRGEEWVGTPTIIHI